MPPQTKRSRHNPHEEPQENPPQQQTQQTQKHPLHPQQQQQQQQHLLDSLIHCIESVIVLPPKLLLPAIVTQPTSSSSSSSSSCCLLIQHMHHHHNTTVPNNMPLSSSSHSHAHHSSLLLTSPVLMMTMPTTSTTTTMMMAGAPKPEYHLAHCSTKNNDSDPHQLWYPTPTPSSKQQQQLPSANSHSPLPPPPPPQPPNSEPSWSLNLPPPLPPPSFIPASSAASHGSGLSHVPVATLQSCLQPIVQSLQAMNAEALLGLRRVVDGVQADHPSMRCRRSTARNDLAATTSRAGTATSTNTTTTTTTTVGGARIRDGVFVHPIHDDIQPPSDPHTVRYLHLSESPDQYSMGIFVFPPFARIPLHDHPGMCVLSRVLYGTLQRLSLDLAREQPLLDENDDSDHDDNESDDIDDQEDDDDHDDVDEDGDDMDVSQEHNGDPIAVTQKLLLRNHNDPSASASSVMNAATLEPSRVQPRSWDPSKPSQSTKSVSPHAWWSQYQRHHPQHLPAGTKLAYQTKAIDNLQAPDCAILFPYEGNLHEFVAGPTGAAVLDVLLPPYDVDGQRDCTFYEVRDCTSKEQAALRMTLVTTNEQGGASQYKQPQSQTISYRHAFGPNQNAAASLASPPTPCWIVPTGQPEDFHCISGTYNGLGCSPAVDDNNESIEYHA